MGKGEEPFSGEFERGLGWARGDGSDRRVHATFPDATLVQVSSDGQHVAYQEGDNVYVAPLPLLATGHEGMRLDRKTPAFTITSASLDGGMYPPSRVVNTRQDGNATKHLVSRLHT